MPSRRTELWHRVPAILCALVCMEGRALSDQTDPRLDALFEALGAATQPAAAAALEQQIWSIWLETGSEEINRQMLVGAAAMDGGEASKALRLFDTVVRDHPRFAEGWNRRATLYFLLGRFPESIADIERTLALEPRHFGALSGLALIREAQNDPFAALEALEQVIRIHPQMPHLSERIEHLTGMLGEAI